MMIRTPFKKTWPRILLGLAAAAVLIGGYAWLSHHQHQLNPRDTTIPTWTQLKDGIARSVTPEPPFGHRWLTDDLQATMGRLGLGMLVGTALAILLGIGMGVSRWLEGLFVPPLALLAQAPPTAMLAVFFVMYGTGLQMYVAMIAFGVMPILAQTVYLAVKDVPDELQYKAYTLGASHAEVIWNVMVPSVLPKVIDAVRLQIGPAVVFLIAAEMIVGDVGFGYRIRLHQRLQDMAVVYPYLVWLMVFGLSVNLGMKRLRRRLCRWHKEGGQ